MLRAKNAVRSITIPEELAAVLEAAASENDTSEADILREWLARGAEVNVPHVRKGPTPKYEPEDGDVQYVDPQKIHVSQVLDMPVHWRNHIFRGVFLHYLINDQTMFWDEKGQNLRYFHIPAFRPCMQQFNEELFGAWEKGKDRQGKWGFVERKRFFLTFWNRPNFIDPNLWKKHDSPYINFRRNIMFIGEMLWYEHLCSFVRRYQEETTPNSKITQGKYIAYSMDNQNRILNGKPPISWIGEGIE